MQPHTPGAAASAAQGSQATEAIPLWDGGVSVGRHVLTRLSLSCLSFLCSHPGVSGTQVCEGLGVRHLSQVSRLLGRLETKGLVHNEPERHGNVWTLTEAGRLVLNEAQPVWSPQAAAGHQGSPLSLISTLPSTPA